METQEYVTLNAADRCDRCGAQAYHVAIKGDLDFMLCAHHHREHETALLADDWKIVSDKSVERLAEPTVIVKT